MTVEGGSEDEIQQNLLDKFFGNRIVSTFFFLLGAFGIVYFLFTGKIIGLS